MNAPELDLVASSFKPGATVVAAADARLCVRPVPVVPPVVAVPAVPAVLAVAPVVAVAPVLWLPACRLLLAPLAAPFKPLLAAPFASFAGASVRACSSKGENVNDDKSPLGSGARAASG